MVWCIGTTVAGDLYSLTLERRLPAPANHFLR
jgi:hypothetical protein